MDRRTLITKALQACGGLLVFRAAPSASTSTEPRNAVMTFAHSWRIETARRIVNQSGEMWLATRDRTEGRNPILIAFNDDRGVEVTRAANHWKLIERTLTAKELAERDECRRHHRLAFYSYLDRTTASRPLPLPEIGQHLVESPYSLRAWIKNGRRPEWQMSIDGVQTQVV